MAHPEPAFGARPRLGRLELREGLSSSFFGARYRARSASTGRSGTHALGTGAREWASPTSGFDLHAVRVVELEASGVIERLALAANAVRGAVHSALFTPLEIVRERGRLAVATIDVPGMTVPQLVARAAARDKGLPQDIVLRIALDLLAGLHALEAAAATSECCECLYGGLTPDSIHVGSDGQTRVLDPGVMAAAARQGYWAVDPRMLAYSAPELHADGGRYHARIDLFAVGVVLWELLSCRSLFLAESADETIEAVCNAWVGRVRRERFVRGEPITAAVANVVARALDREPSQRFQSYREIALALRDAAPVAEAAEVAAFVAAMEAPEREHAFDEAERVTSRLARLERTETTIKLPVAAQQPIAIEIVPFEPVDVAQPIELEAVEAIDVAPVDIEPPIAIETEPVEPFAVERIDIAPLIAIEAEPVEPMASLGVAPLIPISALLEPALSMPSSQAAPVRRRHAAWALGVAVLATLAFVAFVLHSAGAGGGSESLPPHHAQNARPPEPESTRSANAEPLLQAPPPPTPPPPRASAPAEPTPTANAPAEPAPTANAPAALRPAARSRARVATPNARKARPALRRDGPKQPFIPDDI